MCVYLPASLCRTHALCLCLIISVSFADSTLISSCGLSATATGLIRTKATLRTDKPQRQSGSMR